MHLSWKEISIMDYMELPRIDLIVKYIREGVDPTTALSNLEALLLKETLSAVKLELIKKKDIIPFLNGLTIGVIRSVESLNNTEYKLS
jgi:hypothetical protein